MTLNWVFFVFTGMIFACFSGAALFAPDGQYLYLGGTLLSGLSTMFWLGLLNLFFQSQLIFQVSQKLSGYFTTITYRISYKMISYAKVHLTLYLQAWYSTTGTAFLLVVVGWHQWWQQTLIILQSAIIARFNFWEIVHSISLLSIYHIWRKIKSC